MVCVYWWGGGGRCYWKHAATRFQEMVPCVDVRLQHALVHQQGAHGLRNQDVNPFVQLQLFNLAVAHLHPATNACTKIDVTQVISGNANQRPELGNETLHSYWP